MEKSSYVPLFISQEGNGIADCGIGLGKADWKHADSIDDGKMQLAIKRPSPHIHVHSDTHFLVIRLGSLNCLDLFILLLPDVFIAK